MAINGFLFLRSNKVGKELSEAKSGNWKDVLTDFMQLALKDLTGEEKSFQFKTTIFSIKEKSLICNLESR